MQSLTLKRNVKKKKNISSSFNVLLILLILLACSCKMRHNQDMAVCGNNLKRIQLMFKVYGDEHQDMFPPLSSQPGVLMFTTEGMPPTGFGSSLPLTCPTIRHAAPSDSGQGTSGKADDADDQSYFYLGYAVFNDDDIEAFAQAYRKQIAENGTFEEDLVVEEDGETRVIQRLSEAVGRTTAFTYSAPPYHTPSAAPTGDPPLLIERDLGHIDADTDGRPRGAFVLYLHSGIRYVHHGTWPITERTQRILAELAE